jgi:hypothetical protein
LLSASNLISIFSILVGIFMLVFWAALLAKKQVPADQKPWAISFHLAGEWATAALLVVSGFGLWAGFGWARLLSGVSLGMLLYTVVVSPGYYAQLKNKPMVAIFAVLIVLTAIAIIGLFMFTPT